MITKKLIHLSLILAASGSVFLSSCGESGSGHEEDPSPEISVNDQDAQENPERREAVKQIFYTIPSPMEMAALIRKSGADFDSSILNPTEKSEEYTSVTKQALNLGVYGADLSYASMFDQQQQSILYLSAARSLAKKLNVEDAIDNNIIERVNENRNNRDSLLTIVSDAYWSLNGYLKEGDREEVSALVIVGGWVEGLYLATSHVTADNQALSDRIAEQKYSLKDLLALVSSYERAEELAGVKQDLTEIQALFDQVEINKSKTETSKDENGTMVIGGASTTTVSDATMESIKAKIQEVRNQYIQ